MQFQDENLEVNNSFVEDRYVEMLDPVTPAPTISFGSASRCIDSSTLNLDDSRQHHFNENDNYSPASIFGSEITFPEPMFTSAAAEHATPNKRKQSCEKKKKVNQEEVKQPKMGVATIL